MKIKIIFSLSLALALVLSGSVALAFSLPGYGVDVNVDNGSVNVNNNGTNVKVDSTVNSVNVESGGSKVNVESDGTNNVKSVNVTSPSGTSSVNVNTGSGVFNVQVNGQTVELRSDKGSLSVQVGNDLSPSEKKAIISLSGGSDVLIQTEADLEAYNDLVAEFRPGIKQVLVNNNKVMVKYDQPGKFLWFKNSSLNATAEVDADGNVEIKLPWYSFLFSKDTDAVKLNITNQLNDAKNNNELTVSGSAGSNSSVQVRSNAKTVNVVTSAVSISVSN